MDGDGSKLEAGANLQVGFEGNGRLELYDNAAASAVGDIDIGRGPSGGAVVVGATASLSAANVYVGGWSGDATGRGLLAGTGTVRAGNGYGTVMVYGRDPATGQVGTLSAGDVAGEIGTLTIDGYVNFQTDSVLRVDIGKDEFNNPIADKIAISRIMSSSSATLTIDLTSVHSLGTYTIFENPLTINTRFTVNGESISYNSGRFTGLNSILFAGQFFNLDGAAPTNFTSTWSNSIGNGLWNLTDDNWINTASSGTNHFLDGDAVAFVGPVGYTVDIKVGSGAPLGRKTVARMLVDGTGDWTFNGDILADGSKTTLIGQTGKLTLRTTGSTTLTGDNQFHGGVEMTDGTLILGSDRAIGTYATNTTTPANSRGQLTAKSGETATVKITDDRVVSNRFLVEDGGTLGFDLGGNTLTIQGVKNTILADDWSVGGALQVGDDAASALTFVDGD
ncbi:MAG: hypothetical protein LIQ31_03270, partial [Planctomycetes bacterium]|nr:hypothetical protein [Planctomycetota bacterium]